MDNTERKTIRQPLNGRDAFQEHGKLPPQAIDMEEAILGGMMLESGCIHDVASMISVDVFYKESHQAIFEAMDLLPYRHDVHKNHRLFPALL